MADDSLLTSEDAAKILKISKYTLYELVKRGEIPAQRIGRQIRFDRDILQGHIRGNPDPAPSGEPVRNANLRFVGSHDPVLELLIDFLKHSSEKINLLPSFTGSMEGLIALYKGNADVAGVHLWDEQTQEYNLPFIRYVLPEESVVVVNLVQRVQGWIVPPGNPRQMDSWQDITQEGLRFVNRQKGSGTRLRVEAFLRKNVISPATIEGYELEETTHMGVACRVANGEADAGIGVQSVANRLGLDFIPLFHERYDLVCSHETSHSEQWKHTMSILKAPHFHHAVHGHTGYDTTLTGAYIMGGE